MLGVWVRVEINKFIVFLNLVIFVGFCYYLVEVRKDWDFGFYFMVLVDLVINYVVDKEIGWFDWVELWKVRRWVEEWVRSCVCKYVMWDNVIIK